MSARGQRVLAIGLDAAESTMVKTLLEAGKLPNLARVLAAGRMVTLTSAAHISSGAVWPTFLTRTPPTEHGLYGEWPWLPDEMKVRRYARGGVRPFWGDLAARGVRVGAFDVPYSDLVGLEEGFEVTAWGPHEAAHSGALVGPARPAEIVARAGPHPFDGPQVAPEGPADTTRLQALAEDSLEGIGHRGRVALELLGETEPDLGIVLFPELHHAAHVMWHTVAVDDPLFADPAFRAPLAGPSLTDMYVAADREVGRLVDAAGPACSVAVFALHGMRPSRGIPTPVDPLLRARGLARRPPWHQDWGRGPLLAALGATKRRMPAWARELYRARTASETRVRLAQPTVLKSYDWSHTRAFELPTDHYGWVRLNVAGREAEGIVPREEYPELCDAVERHLRELRTRDGRPVVAEVVRPTPTADAAMSSVLPDLVVHWDTAAYDDPLDAGPDGSSRPWAHKLTGRHALDGFCVASGALAESLSGRMSSIDFAGALASAVVGE